MDTPAPGMEFTDYTDFAVRFRPMDQLPRGLCTDLIFPTGGGMWPQAWIQETNGERPHSP